MFHGRSLRALQVGLLLAVAVTWFAPAAAAQAVYGGIRGAVVATHPMLEGVGAALGDGGLPGPEGRFGVVRVDRRGPAKTLIHLRGLAGQGGPAGLVADHPAAIVSVPAS